MAPPDIQAFCKGCGYLLSGVVVRKCPECGRHFDPRAADTWTTNRFGFFGQWLHHAPGAPDLALALAAMALTLYAFSPPGHYGPVVALGMVVWLAVGAIWLLRAGYRLTTPDTSASDPHSFWLRMVLLPLAAAACIFLVRQEAPLRLGFVVAANGFDRAAQIAGAPPPLGPAQEVVAWPYRLRRGHTRWDRAVPFVVVGDNRESERYFVYVPDGSLPIVRQSPRFAGEWTRLSANWFLWKERLR